MQSMSLPSPCTGMKAAISPNSTPKKSKNFVEVDEQFEKMQKRTKELGMSKLFSCLPAGFWVDREMHKLRKEAASR